ncbi:unnamed protein product [Oikopleura dioica]|uniref:Uncharacterized protein n=1 Tax=Oikopleura dioica TaxID=34765 RepID=E4XW71_OIKDI|nr:unnamed protein product [Oikopleura dioica]
MNKVMFAFRQLEQNGKLSCPSPPFLGLLGTKKATKLVTEWDEFALGPRRPAQELELPLLEVFNTRAIDGTLSKYDKIPADQKTQELLQTMLAAALLETLTLPFGPITSIKKLAEILQQQGDVKHDSSRAFLQQEAGHLLRSSEIGISHGDPWLELSKLGRFVTERIWLWVKALNAKPEVVPHDLLPFKFTRHFGDLNLRPQRPGAPAFPSPAGLHMAGKIVRNRTIICTSVSPLEFVSVASNIQAEDFPDLVETFSTNLESFAWDADASMALQTMLKAIEEGQAEAAIAQWKVFVEATKSIPKAKGSTSTLVVSKLATNFVANSAAKNVGELLLKTNENRDNQAIIRFWRHRLGKRRVNVHPRKLEDIPTPAKTQNRRLLISPPKNTARENIFKKREPQTYCAVENCCTPLYDLFVCPLHHRSVADKLQEDKVGTIAPPDFADISGAKRVWAAEYMKNQTPLNLNKNQARAKFHLESIALHNPDVRMELPAAQLRATAMIYHSSGVDVEWGSRSFWKNEGLLRALHTIQCEFVSAHFDLRVLPDPKKPDRMVVPPMGDKLEWVVLPPHMDPRNDPEHEDNRGKDEDGLVWETLILKKDFKPSLGHYTSVGTQKDGTSILFEVSETASGSRKVSSPILAIVKDFKTYCVDPLEEREMCPRECRRIFDELDFTAEDLLRQMRQQAARKIEMGSFNAFPELATLASFAELSENVNFVVSFPTVETLQRAKNFLIRWAKKNNHKEHPNISLFAVGKEPEKENLPQAFFLYRKGQNYKIWRPVRAGLKGKFKARPQTFDEKYEFRFISHMLATKTFPGGLATDNLLGLINEDLLPALEGNRAELYKQLEFGINSLALMIDLNDASALDQLNIVGGEIALMPTWQKSFHFFKEDAEGIRNSQADIRDCQERSRQKLLDRHFPKVLNVKTFLPWLKRFLAKDKRFITEVRESLTQGWIWNSEFPFVNKETIKRMIDTVFSRAGRSTPEKDILSLFDKPSPLPDLPLMGMRLLQMKPTGTYSQVAAYKEAKARMEFWFEARHQRFLQNRRDEAAEEAAELERERLAAIPPALDSSDESELSTDSEVDSDEEFVLYVEALDVPPAEETPFEPDELAPVRPFVFDEWRDNLPHRHNPRRGHPDADNEDECPDGEVVELPLPNRPVTPEEIAEIRGFDAGARQQALEEIEPPRRVIAQIVEDPEFRPVPNDLAAFECKRFFPHERYDELFESGDADKFAEFAEKTREGVRKLLEKDLEHVSHERAFSKIEAVFNEALLPHNVQPSLNVSEQRNKPRRVELPLADGADQDPSVVEDYERLNLGQAPKGIWHLDGEIIVPHRSDRKIKFTDEADLPLESLTVISEDLGRTDFKLENIASASVDLPAIRPLPRDIYGKWRPQRVFADTPMARKNRSRVARNPFFHADLNMKVIGIVHKSQFIESKFKTFKTYLVNISGEKITINESVAQQKHIFELAQIVSNKSMGLTAGLEQAAEELVDLIVANNLSTTLILARLCEAYGTLRPGTIRTTIKQVVRDRRPSPVITLWAKEFQASPTSMY